jgi:BirA family biotin operon repressor/biotin-[acetyl-CoA-carboxylase] ligase
MIQPPDALAVTAWQTAVRTGRRVGHTLEAHELIGSTNDRARELLAEPGGDGAVVLAEEQSAGRGRRGRSWVSPPRRNLTLSVALRPRIAAADGWQLGQAAGLAVAAACATVAPVGLKWPNDVESADGRKVAGLLVETLVEGDVLGGAIIGVGINANWRVAEMPPDIAGRATSLADLAGTEVDRANVLAALLDALDREIGALEAGTSPLDRYRAACTTLGAFVTVATDDGPIHGRATAIDAGGGLVVEAEDGRHVIAAGEVVRVQARDR